MSTSGTTLRRLLELSGLPRRRVGLSIALAATTVLFGIGLITASGYLVSRAAEQPPILSLTATIVIVRFFGLARPIARYLDRLVSHDLALRSLGRIRGSVYERLEPLAPAQLEGFRRGDLVSRIVADVDALQGLYLRGIGPPAAALVVAIVAVGAAAWTLPLAGLLLAIGLVLAGACVPVAAAALSRRSGGRRSVARGALTAELVELLRGAPELVLYGCEAERLEAVRTADREIVRDARRDSIVAGLGTGLVALVAGLTTVAVLAVAVAAHADGQLDPVLIAALALLALASFEAVTTLPGAAQELGATLAAGRRVLALTDAESDVQDPAAPAALAAGPVTVALESVTARYSSQGPCVLAQADLVLPPGRRIALVGRSGAGKTTVTDLLLRFLDPVSGRITIGGTDSRDLRQEDVRRTFALAGQEAHVFNSTIRENLLLGRQQATAAELTNVLRQVRLDEWVTSLPLGLDTLVGEEGASLSGGQRQRLVLARALLVDAPVLVLDEPTAHLDPGTAEGLMTDIFATAGDRSILLITHRQEGLELVDDVFELNDGRIAPAGSSPS